MPVQDRQELRRRLTRVAGAQAGYFTAAQALEAGYSYPAQRYHVSRGNWLRVQRAVFRIPEWPPGSHEDLVRWTLWSRGQAVVSHDTALAVHDLGDANPAQVHLTVPRSFRATAQGVVLHRGELPHEDTQDGDGFRITTPLRTLIDVAGSNLESDALAAAIDDALARGWVTRRMLRQRADAVSPQAALRIERALSALPA